MMGSEIKPVIGSRNTQLSNLLIERGIEVRTDFGSVQKIETEIIEKLRDELKNLRREFEDLREKNIRLEEENRVLVDRDKRSEERLKKVKEEFLNEKIEKNKVIELLKSDKNAAEKRVKMLQARLLFLQRKGENPCNNPDAKSNNKDSPVVISDSDEETRVHEEEIPLVKHYGSKVLGHTDNETRVDEEEIPLAKHYGSKVLRHTDDETCVDKEEIPLAKLYGLKVLGHSDEETCVDDEEIPLAKLYGSKVLSLKANVVSSGKDGEKKKELPKRKRSFRKSQKRKCIQDLCFGVNRSLGQTVNLDSTQKDGEKKEDFPKKRRGYNKSQKKMSVQDMGCGANGSSDCVGSKNPSNCNTGVSCSARDSELNPTDGNGKLCGEKDVSLKNPINCNNGVACSARDSELNPTDKNDKLCGVKDGLKGSSAGVSSKTPNVPAPELNPTLENGNVEKDELKHCAEAASEGSCSMDLEDSDADSEFQRNQGSGGAWLFDSDMCLALVNDPELCLNAVCALYRQEICHPTSSKTLNGEPDIVRLAKYLIQGHFEKKLTRKVSEVSNEMILQCKQLALANSVELFNIYSYNRDPFFNYKALFETATT